MFRTYATDELIEFNDDVHEMHEVFCENDDDCHYNAQSRGAYARDEKGAYGGSLVYLTLKLKAGQQIEKISERSGVCLGCGRGVTVINYTQDGEPQTFRGGCGCSDGEKPEDAELKRVLYAL